MIENIFKEKNFKIIKKQPIKKNKIKIKFGIDPTYNKLHLGHIYILNKIKKLQIKNKAIAIIIIGTHTALIGDPSKRFIKRKNIINKNIKNNYKKLKKQIKKLLLKKKTLFFNNKTWLENININIIQKIGIKKLLKRKEIKKRIKKENNNITLGELIYPFYQYYDNLITKPNIEIGGKDQIFNFFYKKQKKINYIACNLIKSINSEEKMSSTNKKNSIFFEEKIEKIFWKIMKIKDENIKHYFGFFQYKKKNKKIIEKFEFKNKKIKKKIMLFLTISLSLKNKKKNIIKTIKKFIENKPKKSKYKTEFNKNKNFVEYINETKLLESKKKIRELIKQKVIKIKGKESLKLNKGINKILIGKKKIIELELI